MRSTLEQKISALEEQLYSKEKSFKVEQRQWEARAEERQSIYRSELQKLEQELIEMERKLPNEKSQSKTEKLSQLKKEEENN